MVFYIVIVPLNEPNDRADFWLWHHLGASHKVRNYTSLLFQNHLLSTSCWSISLFSTTYCLLSSLVVQEDDHYFLHHPD